MDEEKKYTNETENKNPFDEFGDFNFTDDFPNEFSDDFTQKKSEEKETFNPDMDFDDFMQKKPEENPFNEEENTFKPDIDFDDDFMQKKPEVRNPYDEETFKSDIDFDDDFMQEKPQPSTPTDEFSEPFHSEVDFDNDFLPKDPYEAEQINIEEPDTGFTQPAAEERRGNLLKRHPWITTLIFIGLVYGGYKLMQSTGSNEITPVPSVSTAKPAQTTQALPKNGEARQIGERLDSIEQTLNALNTQLSQMQNAHVRIEQMEKMVTKIAEEERGLNATLTRLDALSKQVNSLTALDQRLNTIEAQMGVIEGEVQLHITVAEQNQRAANLSRQAMQAKSMVPIPMVVQAAIPGRAWLLSQTGELLTVARGDEVAGYGHVMNIDPVAGTVTMSSETIFREQE